MNLIGKIFTVLIFVLCLVVATFSALVYGSHKNWRDAIVNPTLGLDKQIADAKAANDQLVAENNRVNEARDREKAEAVQIRGKLETKNQELSAELAETYATKTAVEKKNSDLLAAIEATQKENRTLAEEISLLRTDIRKARIDRDNEFKEVVRLTDEVHLLADERIQLNKRNLQLLQDLNKVREVLRYLGYANEKLDIKSLLPPHPLDGVILAVQNPKVVEISLGADDGLRKGHKLEVVRVGGGVNNYVGRIEVVRTTPNRAVCRVIPEMLKMPMQRGDRVYDRLD